MKEKIRRFKTGATRSDDTGRIDPEAALSPLVLNEYCEHIKAHRLQPDGSIRADDNWKKGFPYPSCAKGLNRHHLHFWLRHHGFPVTDPKAEPNIKRDLCAIIFNAQVYLHQLLKAEIEAEKNVDDGECDGENAEWICDYNRHREVKPVVLKTERSKK